MESETNPPQFELRPPITDAEWERYFDLRWRVLRAAWQQPRGSEQDELESSSFHLAAWSPDGAPVAAGRLHFNSTTEAQIRYMAVEPAFVRSGLGTRILEGLEAEARLHGALTIVLNSRRTAQGFYARHGYEVIGEAGTKFGAVEHVRMAKRLNQRQIGVSRAKK